MIVGIIVVTDLELFQLILKNHEHTIFLAEIYEMIFL